MDWVKLASNYYLDPAIAGLGADGEVMYVRGLAYCGGQETEGFIPAAVCPMLTRKSQWRKVADQLVSAGLWAKVDEKTNGFRVKNWAKFQKSLDDLAADRRAGNLRQTLFRDPEMKDAIRSRDGNRCRYCSTTVDWKDRRSGTGGTYDHVDPAGGHRLDNIVVACRACNAQKGRRTPEEAGMTLLPVTSYKPESNNPRGRGRGRDTELLRSSAQPADAPSLEVVPTTEPEPTPATTALACRDDQQNAQTLVAEWIEHCQTRPPRQVIGQVSKQLRGMLDEGIPYTAVRTGLAHWFTKGLHPATLPSVVNEVMNARPAAAQAQAQAARPSTTDQRVATGLALAAELEAEESNHHTEEGNYL